MTSISNEPGIFIHSLWRSASTYLFNAFRRSDAGYWAYQEPLHEIILVAKANPEILSAYTSEALAPLRHPQLQKPYFYELQETHQAWCEMVKKCIIYDDYFGTGPIEPLANYLRTLLSSAKGRPVIQECRTSGRIGAIKRSLGGLHIYLWRNPWDQWWSFKLSDYFDAAYQIILGAYSSPAIIARLREEIGYSEFHHDNVDEEFNHFMQFRLSSENSYLVFYTLWCLGLLEGMAYADQMLNIDSLSTSQSYRIKTQSDFEALGILGVEFSDCLVPQGFFDTSDKEFFTNIENRVHGLLLVSGYTQETVNTICHLRGEHAPSIHSDTNTLVRDLQRARQTALRLETTEASRGRHFHQLIDDLDAQAKVLERDLNASKLQLETIGGQLELSERQAREAADTLALTKRELSDHLQSSQNYLQTSQLSLFELTKSHAEREHVLNQQVQLIQQELLQAEQEQLQLEKELAEQTRQALQEQANLNSILVQREEAFANQLLAVQHEKEQEKIDLATSYKEQEQLLLLKKAELEQCLSQQLKDSQDEMLNLQENFVKREQSLSEQTIQARQEVETLLHTLEQREQEVATELLLIRQQADQDKAILANSHSEQVHQLLSQQAERESSLNHQVEAVQEELCNLRKDFEKREQLSSDRLIQARQEAGTLLRSLAQRKQEVAAEQLLIRQQADQDKAALANSHSEQVRQLLSQQAERECSLNQQMEAIKEELCSLQQDFEKREQLLLAQVIEARQEAERLLHTLAQSEEDSASKLLDNQRQAEHDKAVLLKSHNQQTQALKNQNLELKQALSKQLKVTKEEQLKRENQLSEHANRARLQMEELLRTLAQREQEVVLELRAIRRQADLEKAEQARNHAEQTKALNTQYAKLEKTLNHQLHNKQQEIRSLQKNLIKREREVMEHLLEIQAQAGREKEYAEQVLQAQQALENLKLMLEQREQEFVAMQHQAEKEMAEQACLYDEQTKALQLSLVEQEHVFSLQLNERQEELLRVEQERMKLEHLLTEQVEHTQQLKENFQLTLAQREQEVALQLLVLHKQTDEEKTELTHQFNELEQSLQHQHRQREEELTHRLQAKHEEQQFIEHEWTQHEIALRKEITSLQNEVDSLMLDRQAQKQLHETELRGKLNEHNLLLEACAALEARLKADVLAEQQTSLLLQQALAQIQHSLVATHASLVWRLMKPIYTVGSAVIPKKALDTITQMFLGDNLGQVISTSSIELNQFNFKHSSMGPDMFETSHSAKVTPPPIATSLDELLAHHDQQFVYCAFRTLLGRYPDPEGLGYYLGRLRSGFSKMRLVAQIRLSDEGAAYNARLSKLDETIERFQRGQGFLLGWLFRSLDKTEGDNPTERNLRSIDNQLFLFREESNSRFNRLEEKVSSLYQLIVRQSQSLGAVPASLVAGVPDQKPVMVEQRQPVRIVSDSQYSAVSGQPETGAGGLRQTIPEKDQTVFSVEGGASGDGHLSIPIQEYEKLERLSLHARKIYANLKNAATHAHRMA